MHLLSEPSPDGGPPFWTATIACPRCDGAWSVHCAPGITQDRAAALAELHFAIAEACPPCLEHPTPARPSSERLRRAGVRIHHAVCGRDRG